MALSVPVSNDDVTLYAGMMLFKETWLRNMSGASCRLMLKPVGVNSFDVLRTPLFPIYYHPLCSGILA